MAAPQRPTSGGAKRPQGDGKDARASLLQRITAGHADERGKRMRALQAAIGPHDAPMTPPPLAIPGALPPRYFRLRGASCTVSHDFGSVPKQQRAATVNSAPPLAHVVAAPREMRDRIRDALELLKSAPAPVASLTKYVVHVYLCTHRSVLY